MVENTPNQDEAKKKAKRRPSAKKRDLQNAKRNKHTRSFKASIATAVRALKECVAKNEKPIANHKLQEIYSLMDKGVKKGIYKLNKARRVKAQTAMLVHPLT